MSKVNVISAIENLTKKEILKIETTGICTSDKLVYKENEVLCEWDFNNVVYKRKINENESFSFFFKEMNNSYIRYENSTLNQRLDIPLYTKKLIKEEKKIDILYQVDLQDEFHLILEYKM